MGKPTAFLELKRKEHALRARDERVRDFNIVYVHRTDEELTSQASRCMDCGVPFCHQGCPLGNLIPEWNDLVYRGEWDEALTRLHATNNFPEFTGAICPAPCEAACVLDLQGEPVTIKDVELSIVERGFHEGRIAPEPAAEKTGARIAVIGSGPAGLACAQQLARRGHDVVVFEKSDRVGGLLRYGVPDFKLERSAVDRRIAQLREEGVAFVTNANVGVSPRAEGLLAEFDAVCIATGAGAARALCVPGDGAHGVHYAMDYLTQQNRIIAGDAIAGADRIDANGKRVVILGGGDTGADCLGTAHRQGAAHVTQLDITPKPPETRDSHRQPWPLWPNVFRTSPAHEEGGERAYSLMTTRVLEEAGRVTGLETVEVTSGPSGYAPVAGTEKVIPCDLVLLAMGFSGPSPSPLYEGLGVAVDARGCVVANEDGKTNNSKVFVAGDARRGASLVVWAIAEGRKVSESIHDFVSERLRERALEKL